MAKKPKPELGLYRPTTLKLANQRCPGAIEFYGDPAPDYRRIFQHGTAAHAILERVGAATKKQGRVLDTAEADDIARRVCEVLISKGRTFDGVPEPPLVPDLVFRGRDLALDWIAKRPLQPDGSLYEVALAVDVNWKPVPYFVGEKVNPAARFRCILDVLNLGDQADEESVDRVMEITDYKTSWSDEEETLDQLQLRSQAVMGWLHYGPEIDTIHLRIVNLRRLKVYQRTLWIGGGDDETLEEWRQDVEQQMVDLDRQRERGRGKLICIPGEGCIGCPYVPRCKSVLDMVEHSNDMPNAEWRGKAYAAVIARIKNLKDALLEDTAEGPVDIGKALVGTLPRPRRVLKEGSHRTMADEWLLHSGGESRDLLVRVVESWGDADAWESMSATEILARLAKAMDRRRADDVASLLFALKPTVTAAENLAKMLFPESRDRADRDAFVDGLIEFENTRSFRVERKSQNLLAALEESLAAAKEKETTQ